MTAFRVLFTLAIIVTGSVEARAQTQIVVNGALPPATTTVSAGSSVSVTVSNGPANATDWVGFYAVGAADNAYLTWRYLNGTTVAPATGVADATLIFPVPVTPGDYEFRLFANNGYTRLATSGIVSVSASSAQLTVNGVAPPAGVSAGVGTSISVVMSGGPGNTTDWIAFFPLGAADNAYLDWRYLNNTTVPPATGPTDASVSFVAPATPGDYEVRFFANNGFGRLATSGIVTIVPSPAQLTVNGTAPPTAVSVGAGTHVTVDVTDGPANPGDWVGMFAVNALDNAFTTWRYLNGTTTLPATGMGAASLNFAVPTSAGSYEFRFFAANGFTRLATNTTVVVESSAAQLAVNGVSPPTAVTVPAGSVGVVSVSGGPANPADWVGLYVGGAANTAYIDWRYLNDTTVPPAEGVPAGTLHFTMPTAAGSYDFRFFADNGYGLLATSSSVTIPPPAAQISVNGVLPPSPVTTQPGATINAQVTGGPGNPTDWLALVPSGAPDSSYLTWMYLNGTMAPPATGLTTATLSLTLPPEPGTYELRLFANNGFGHLATSSPITASSAPPEVTIRLTSPFPGTTFVQPAAIEVQAEVTVTNGTIASVDFLADGTLIGTAVSSPYQIAWSSPPVGTHALTATARDSASGATTSLPVSITVSATGAGFGTLGPPITMPGGGVYGPNLTVTLEAAPGATIRYTTDGSTPTATSAMYGSAIPVGQSTTVRAAAFQDGWSASAVVTEIYTIDATPPAIIGSLSPAPNAAGWNNTDVTVTFVCTDVGGAVASCPLPYIFNAEGINQTISVMATDHVGNQASLEVTASIDKTAPSVIVNTPSEGQTTLTAIGTNAVVSDLLSGVLDATCNGASAAVAGGVVNCTVPLGKGFNVVVVEASDVAGNSASASVRVMRTGDTEAFSVMPSRFALSVGESVPLRVVDDYGRVMTGGLTWTSEDSFLATVDSDGVVTAVGVGEVTITAAAQPLSAQATITVFPAGPLPVGTTRWSVDPLPGYSSYGTVAVGPVGPDSTAFVAVESDGTSTIIRGLNIAGQQTYLAAAPVASDEVAWPIMGDVNGGVLLSVMTSDPNRDSLVRFRTVENGTWRHAYPGSAGPAAQSPDGTIYLGTFDGVDSRIVAVNGMSGSRVSTIPLPRSSVTSWYTDETCNVYPIQYEEYPAGSPDLKIGPDGAAYFVAFVSHTTSLFHHCYGDLGSSLNQQVLLYRATGGAPSFEVLREYDYAGPPAAGEPYSGDTLGSFGVMPDDQGGILAHWPECRLYSGGPICSTRARHGTLGLMLGEFDLPVIPTISGSDRVAYGQGGGGVAKIDMTNGLVQWTSSTSGIPVAALDGGSLAVATYPDTTILDADGNAASTGLPYVVPSVTIDDLWLTGSAAVVGASVGVDFAAGFPLQTGNAQFNKAPSRRYDSLDAAAIAMLYYVYPFTEISGWEFGGRICRSANFFYPSHSVTDKDAGRVHLPEALCGSFVSVGVWHTHVPASLGGDPFPSGFDPPGAYEAMPESDMRTANENPGLTFYLMAPNWGVSSPPTHVIRYEKGLSHPLYNTYEWTGVWPPGQANWVHVPYPLTPRPW